MVLTAAYIATAMLLAPVVFVAAEWVGHDHPPRLTHRVAYSVLAAVLWPLLAVGLAQFAVIAAARHVVLSRSAGPGLPTADQSCDDADTAKLPRVTVPYVRVQIGTPAH